MKVLIIHTWGIGDLVMFTPALRLLRQNFPEAQIDILITYSPVVAEVLEEGKTVNRIFKLIWSGSLVHRLKFIQSILKLRKERYDWALVTSWTNPLKGGVLAFLAGAKFRAGAYQKNRSPFYTHQTPGAWSKSRRETDLDLTRFLGIDVKESPESFFEFGLQDKEFAKDFLRKKGLAGKTLIGFHPGAEPVHRYLLWPKEYFIALGKDILEKYKDANLLIFCGPGEKDRLRRGGAPRLP